jgi:hypothetical protein
MTVKELKARKPRGPTLVRGLVQLGREDIGWTHLPDKFDRFIIKDHPDSREVLSFDLLRNSPEGRRLHYLLRDGATRAMTLRLEGFMSTPYDGDSASLESIVSED